MCKERLMQLHKVYYIKMFVETFIKFDQSCCVSTPYFVKCPAKPDHHIIGVKKKKVIDSINFINFFPYTIKNLFLLKIYTDIQQWHPVHLLY